MSLFYTNVQSVGSNILYRGITDGKRTKIKRSREFLRGAGADLGLLTFYTPYNGKQQPTLHDVMIINDPNDTNYVYLQKVSNE
jgi:hypothetical protein